LGESGETYLVAADKTLRSMSRFLIAVIEMDHSQKSANAGKQKMAETGNALTSIRDAVDSISDLNFQIASAAEEQSNVAEELNDYGLKVHRLTTEG